MEERYRHLSPKLPTLLKLTKLTNEALTGLHGQFFVSVSRRGMNF